MLISLVVAASENNAIGKDNKLLWHLPNDMRFFKNTTWAMPVIMGRKTFEALGKPLTGRTNIVITRQKTWKAEGAKAVKNMDEAIREASHADAKEAFVIGGGEIYRQSMSRARKIYLTRVHAALDGDTYFPEVNEIEWNLVSNLDFDADNKHAFSYSFQIWERKRSSVNASGSL
ncbi:MAG: dihydrofolate reductase [Chitinophagaceae bacterium]|nr:dihydrofolate reductase [Chitinophagaceae bacterium]